MATIYKSDGRVTIYKSGEMMGNYARWEARCVEVDRQRYAQYPNAIRVRFILKGARSVKGFWLTYEPRCVILAGWNHFAPRSLFADAEIDAATGLSVAKGRHSGFSRGWDRDFDADLAAHVAATGARIVFDARGWNASAEAESGAA